MWYLLLCLLAPSSDLPRFQLEPESAETRRWISFLRGERASQTRIALSNARFYVQDFKAIFREEGVPVDLVWVAFIETSFRPDPTSPTGAQGMYQFKAETARAFGLKVNRRVDERNIPNKAARAAARYLRYLQAKFTTWELTLAAYNLGEGDLHRTMKRHGHTTWLEVKPLVRRQTQEYVGKVKAAAVIGNAYLAEYGSLETFQGYRVLKGDSLLSIARKFGVTLAQLKELNGLYEDHIYPGQYLAIPAHESGVQGARHVVRRGETLFQIAARYGVSLEAIKTANQRNSNLINPGDVLVIPFQVVRYRVRQGDTLSSIARAFDIDVQRLMQVNGLQGPLIHRDQELVIPVK